MCFDDASLAFLFPSSSGARQHVIKLQQAAKTGRPPKASWGRSVFDVLILNKNLTLWLHDTTDTRIVLFCDCLKFFRLHWIKQFYRERLGKVLNIFVKICDSCSKEMSILRNIF